MYVSQLDRLCAWDLKRAPRTLTFSFKRAPRHTAISYFISNPFHLRSDPSISIIPFLNQSLFLTRWLARALFHIMTIHLFWIYSVGWCLFMSQLIIILLIMSLCLIKVYRRHDLGCMKELNGIRDVILEYEMSLLGSMGERSQAYIETHREYSIVHTDTLYLYMYTVQCTH